MNTYLIHESNLERLEKKLNTIKNKCNQNQVSFTYNIVGEEFHTTIDESSGKEYTARFLVVEVEGQVKHEGWEFAATIDHHETGNVLRAYKTDISIPEKYWSCGPTCEHCNKIRSRKDTYLIYNAEKNEFKQVGRNCMKEYTNGLDAEQVAFFLQFFQEMESGYGYSGAHYESYIELDEVLRYAFEAVKHFGYEKAYDNFGDPNEHSTKRRVRDYMNVHRSGYYSQKEVRRIEDEMSLVGFNPSSEYAVESSKAAVEWITSQDDKNEYMHNLKVICSSPYMKAKDFGIAVSLPAAYNRYLKQEEYKAKEAARAAQGATDSEYQGEIGQRITFTLKDAELVTTIDSYYGTSWLYKLVDENDNVYVWYSSNPVDEDKEYTTCTGTVKQHSEYNGVKQTVINRCKLA